MSAIKHILAPVDFSERSEAAAEDAHRLSEWFGANLTLLHVCPSVQVARTYRSPAQIEQSEMTQLESSRRLEGRLKGLASQLGAEVRAELAEGDPAACIEDYVREHAVDLVVAATHGLGRFRRYLLGSLTSKLLHDLDVPIVTGTHREGRVSLPESLSNVGCALGLRNLADSERILRWAGDFAKLVGARLTVIHVPSSEDPSSPLIESVKESHDKAAREIAALLEKTGLTAEVAIQSGSPMDTVVSQIQGKGCDALVIGRTPKKGAFLVGHADGYALIRQSPVPVFSV